MSSPAYCFHGFRLDPASRELWRGKEEVTLQLKVFDCILYLIEHRDRAVGRDELIDTVWGEEVHLSDSVLGKAISFARDSLGDTGEEQRFIKTIRGYGYRWVAPVEVVDAQFAAGGAASPKPLPWRRLVLAMLAVVLVAGALHLRRSGDRGVIDGARSRPAEGGIALLLPVAVDSGTDAAWMRLGLMDHIAERLRAAGQPVVPSDTVIAMMRGFGEEPDPDELDRLATATGAQLVLSAKAEMMGAQWRVSLRSLVGANPVSDTRGESDDVLEAARLAADGMALSMGREPPPDPSDMTELTTLLQRAEAARLAEQMDVARSLLEEADPELRQHVKVRLKLARIDLFSHRLDSAQAALERLLGERALTRDAMFRASVLYNLSILHFWREAFEVAESSVEEAARLASAEPASRTLGRILTLQGALAQVRNDFDAARVHLVKARVVLEGTGDVIGLASLDNNLGVLEAQRERYAEAVHYFESAADRDASLHSVSGELTARANLINSHLRLLDLEAASAILPRLNKLIERTNNPRRSAVAKVREASLLIAKGQLDEAKRLLDEVLVTSIGKDMYRLRMRAMLLHAEQAVSEGESGRAADQAEEILHQVSLGRFQLDEFIARAGLVLVRARLIRNDLTAAAEAVTAMYERAEHSDAPSASIYATLGEAELASAKGRGETAKAAYEHALALADASHTPLRLLHVAQSYVSWLLTAMPDGARDPERALVVAGRVAAYAERDYGAALLQVRAYHAGGPPSAWRAVLVRARRLAGERQIPPELLVRPESGGQAAREPQEVTLK